MDGLIALPVTSCDGCGACCEEAGLPPGYLDPERLTFLPETLRDELRAHQEEEKSVGWTRRERGLPCLWYDTGTRRCRHYDLRPPTCREVAVGGASCRFWRERRLGP